MAHTDCVKLRTVALIAHQGGWDEILLVAAPIAVFAGLLIVANRRAGQQQGERATSDVVGSESGTSGD